MVKSYYYEIDYLEKNKKQSTPSCKYCGYNVSESSLEYCSKQCRQEDAVWHCEDSAVQKNMTEQDIEKKFFDLFPEHKLKDKKLQRRENFKDKSQKNDRDD